MPTWNKVSGVWKQVDTPDKNKVKVGGAWKDCENVYVKTSGVWKPLYVTTPQQLSPICGPAFVFGGFAFNGHEQVVLWQNAVNACAAVGALSSAAYGGSCYRNSCGSITLNPGYFLTWSYSPCNDQLTELPGVVGTDGYTFNPVHGQDIFFMYVNGSCAGCGVASGTASIVHGRVLSYYWIWKR